MWTTEWEGNGKARKIFILILIDFPFSMNSSSQRNAKRKIKSECEDMVEFSFILIALLYSRLDEVKRQNEDRRVSQKQMMLFENILSFLDQQLFHPLS